MTRLAMGRGEVSEEQARAIVAAVGALPEDLEPGLAERAEKELVHHAGGFDAVDLRRLGKTILEVVAPDVAEEHLARQLADEERAAAQDHRFTMSEDGHGRCHGRFTLPASAGEVLRRALQASAAPKHRAAEGIPAPAVRAPSPQRMGEAFAAYVLGYPADDLPRAGGVNATVVVTTTMENLTGDCDAPVVLDTGDLMTAGQARRWACEAGLVPVVLGTGSVVLDMGRRARFHTPAQRTAIALRDKTCTVAGCDWPPGMCQVHHDIPWGRGGRTNVETGRLLCPRHHQMIHDEKHLTEKSKNGRLVFRRAWVAARIPSSLRVQPQVFSNDRPRSRTDSLCCSVVPADEVGRAASLSTVDAMAPEFADHRPGRRRTTWDGVLVRDLRRDDAATCARLLAEREGWTDERAGSVVAGWLAASPDAGLSLVAERRGVVHAYARAVVVDPAAAGGHGPAGWCLDGLLAAPGARRRGLGALLTRARLDRLSREADEVWFFTNTRNRPSIDLHVGLGFRFWTSELSIPGVEFVEGAGALYRWTGGGDH